MLVEKYWICKCIAGFDDINLRNSKIGNDFEYHNNGFFYIKIMQIV